MTLVVRSRVVLIIGLVLLVIGFDRLVNAAMLRVGVSAFSTPLVIGLVCVLAGAGLVVAALLLRLDR